MIILSNLFFVSFFILIAYATYEGIIYILLSYRYKGSNLELNMKEVFRSLENHSKEYFQIDDEENIFLGDKLSYTGWWNGMERSFKIFFNRKTYLHVEYKNSKLQSVRVKFDGCLQTLDIDITDKLLPVDENYILDIADFLLEIWRLKKQDYDLAKKFTN